MQHDILRGFVPNMRVPGTFYLNSDLLELQMEELQQYATAGGVGGFLPAVKQIANVAALPGIVGVSARGAGGSIVWSACAGLAPASNSLAPAPLPLRYAEVGGPA